MHGRVGTVRIHNVEHREHTEQDVVQVLGVHARQRLLAVANLDAAGTQI